MQALVVATRSWPMLAAFGAGLVLMALAAGAGGAAQPALIVLGIAALGWGVLALRAGRVLVPSVVLVATAVTLVGMAAAVATGASVATDIPPGPLAAASVFIVVMALSAGLELRGRTRRARRDEPLPAGRGASAPRPAGRGASEASVSRPARREASVAARLIGLASGAALVAALATPALAATEAGEQAVPHGMHQLDPIEQPGGHGH
ncbi:hypothetical protein [Agromyces subbeticus]|uniref:hypothetical protein n=1 Tax=Agromyces subbeticus TaxID=293890 RepID=UPI0003B442E2|nr:hypothetical protein [Agromyces subbeticus]